MRYGTVGYVLQIMRMLRRLQIICHLTRLYTVSSTVK